MTDRKAADSAYNASRRKRHPHHKLYKRRKWTHELRPRQLKRQPLCEICREPAEHVDHREPHNGDMRLFSDPKNLRSLCKRCHGSITRGRHPKATGVDGQPLDPSHPWYDKR